MVELDRSLIWINYCSCIEKKFHIATCKSLDFGSLVNISRQCLFCGGKADRGRGVTKIAKFQRLIWKRGRITCDMKEHIVFSMHLLIFKIKCFIRRFKIHTMLSVHRFLPSIFFNINLSMFLVVSMENCTTFLKTLLNTLLTC